MALLAGLLLAAPAAAHVTVQPGASRPGELQRYTVFVPTEESSATTGVAIRVPKGVDFLLVESTPGWASKVVRKDDAVSEVHWTKGKVPPDHYAELHFIARNPVGQGEATFPAVQTYASGSVVRWIGGADSDHPAPHVDISESATPVDVVSTHGEAVPTGTATGAAKTTAADAAADTDARDGLTLALAIVALVVALAGLGVAFTAARRRRPLPADGSAG